METLPNHRLNLRIVRVLQGLWVRVVWPWVKFKPSAVMTSTVSRHEQVNYAEARKRRKVADVIPKE